MDINNYSYTPHMLEEDSNEIANYEDFDGYGYVSIEQWGCMATKKVFSVFICHYNGDLEISEAFLFDTTDIYSINNAREDALRLYNKYVPENEVMPLF